MKLGFLIVLLFLTGLTFCQNVDPNGYNTFYYSEGNISSEGTLKNGKPDAYWKSYYENGHLKSEGNRDSFLLDGPWKFYTEEGKLKEIIEYKRGKKNGFQKFFSLDSICMLQYQFIDNLKQGNAKECFSNGMIFKEYKYLDNQIVDDCFEYDTLGNIVTIYTYKLGTILKREDINRWDKSARKHGLWKSFYEDKLLESELFYNHGVLDGVAKYYLRDGSLKEIKKFDNGEEEKEAAEIQQLEVDYTYYDDGTVASSGSFVADKPIGIHRKFDNKGTLLSSKVFSETGSIKSDGKITKAGIKDGPWKEYYNDGTLKMEGLYKNDIKVGLWKYYHANGSIEQEGKYNAKGNAIDLWKWYYDTGVLEREEFFIDGLEDGEIKVFGATIY